MNIQTDITERSITINLDHTGDRILSAYLVDDKIRCSKPIDFHLKEYLLPRDSIGIHKTLDLLGLTIDKYQVKTLLALLENKSALEDFKIAINKIMEVLND